MNAEEHMIEIPELDKAQSAKACLDIMLEFECFELPVISAGLVVGKVRLDDCIDNPEAKALDLMDEQVLRVHLNTHLFDLMKLFKDSKTDLAAVVDLDSKFLGIISKGMVLNRLSRSISVEQEGAIILLEMAATQYSSSQIAQIVEGENAQILGLWLEQIPDSGRIRASVKVNTHSAERIISSLLRFKYEVITSFGDDDYKERVERRYQAFIKYLDI